MSAAFHVSGEVIEQIPGGPPLGKFYSVHRDLVKALADFTMLVAITEAAELAWSS